MARDVIGYGCISAAVLKKDREAAIENSKVMEDLTALHDKIHGLFIPEENIEIDILTGNRRNRKKLKEIIEELTSDPTTMFNRPRGTIVVASISDLGNTSRELIENFDRIVPLNIGLLVADNEEYSTVNYGFQYYPDIEERIPRIREALKKTDSSKLSRRGRRKSDAEVTPEFKEIYWYYENYFIPEPLAYENNRIGKISKTVFKNLCRAYEESPEYPADEEYEVKINPDLILKPKRYGTIPENFTTVRMLKETEHCPIEIACSEANASPMTEITFRRFIEKQKGKKAMGKATFTYRNDEIIRSLEIN